MCILIKYPDKKFFYIELLKSNGVFKKSNSWNVLILKFFYIEGLKMVSCAFLLIEKNKTLD